MKSIKELLDEAEVRQSITNEDNPYSKYYHMNNTASPRSYDYPDIALLDKQIAEIEAKIKERDANKVQQPKTQVGWSSYVVNNDRGLLDNYQEAERAWYNKLKDQELAYAQMKNAKDLAEAQHKEQRSIQLNEARDTLAKLQIMKDNAAQQGHDTREIDLQMATIYRDYPELSVNVEEAEEYDPRSSVEYVLADVEDIDVNNTQDEINNAINRVAKFKTPESIKVLNKLDKTLTQRIKKEESQDKYNAEVNAWTKGGATSKYLYNLGYETQFAGDKERLVNKKTNKIIAERPRYRKSSNVQPKSTTSKSTTTNDSGWEL